MVDVSESGLCPLCLHVPGRTNCTLPRCKNSVKKVETHKISTLSSVGDARKQMEELNRFAERINEGKK